MNDDTKPPAADSADWLRHAYADQTIRAMKAEAEIERLRSYTYGYTSGISPGFEVKLTLTDEEREAVEEAAESYADGCNERCVKIAATFRNLLERTK